MDHRAGVSLQATDYSQESEFLKICARSDSFNVAKMANDSIIVTSTLVKKLSSFFFIEKLDISYRETR